MNLENNIMKDKNIYKCKDNDVVLRFEFEDGKIDEIWIQVEGETSWTIIGFKDLQKGIRKAKQNIKNGKS